MFLPSVLVPLVLSKLLTEHAKSQFRLDSSGTVLDGGSFASHSSQPVGRYSSVLSCHKRSLHGCFSRPGAQGSAISAFNPLAAKGYMLHRQGFTSSVRQWQGYLKCLQ